MRLLSSLTLVLLILATSSCQWAPAFDSEHPPTDVGVLEDPTGHMGITQAASPQIAQRYQIKHRSRMSLGFSRSALWVRLPLDQTPREGRWVLEVAAPWMDRVDLYLPRPGGGWQRRFTGLQQPWAANRLGVFALPAPADTPRSGYAYLRLQSILSLNAGLRIWPEASFEIGTVFETFLYGLLYGVMGALVLINLLVLRSTRDRAYLLYICYLVSIMAHQMCLQGQVLYLPTSLWHLVPAISLVVSSTLFFFGAAFCRVFLDVKRYAPLADRLLIAMQFIAGALLLLALTGRIWWGTWLVHGMAMVGPLIAVYAGIKALRQGFKPARYYLMAWVVLLFGAVTWAAWSMGAGFLASLPRSLITVAAALECVLLSMALADRIGVMQRESLVLAQRERRYRRLSTTDELTGLFNSRYFWSKLSSEIILSHELGHPLGLVLLDVDDFKRFNDTYGHTEGDKVLSTLGNIMRSAVRPGDSPCRYGGDEFAILLPGADGQAAHMVSQRVQNALSQCEFLPGDWVRESVTISLGTAQLQPGDDADSLVKRADQSLYQAKGRGKNQIVQADKSQGSREEINIAHKLH